MVIRCERKVSKEWNEMSDTYDDRGIPPRGLRMGIAAHGSKCRIASLSNPTSAPGIFTSGENRKTLGIWETDFNYDFAHARGRDGLCRKRFSLAAAVIICLILGWRGDLPLWGRNGVLLLKP